MKHPYPTTPRMDELGIIAYQWGSGGLDVWLRSAEARDSLLKSLEQFGRVNVVEYGDPGFMLRLWTDEKRRSKAVEFITGQV